MDVLPSSVGVTFPRIEALTDAYVRRRLRELREVGSVTALAVRAPEQLSDLEAAQERPTVAAHEDPEVQALVRRWVHGE